MGQIFPVPIVLNNSKSNKRAIFNRFWDPRDLWIPIRFRLDESLSRLLYRSANISLETLSSSQERIIKMIYAIKERKKERNFDDES